MFVFDGYEVLDMNEGYFTADDEDGQVITIADGKWSYCRSGENTDVIDRAPKGGAPIGCYDRGCHLAVFKTRSEAVNFGDAFKLGSEFGKLQEKIRMRLQLDL